MSSKKKKVYLLFLPLWMGALCIFAYNIGYKRGLQDSNMPLSSQGSPQPKDLEKAKVQRLTFFDTLHQPPQIPHEMIEPSSKSAPKKQKPKAVDTVENVVEQQLAQSNLQASAPPKTERVSQEDDKEVKLKIDKKDHKNQKVAVYNKEYTLDQMKRLPWAVQVGAFSDGVQAILLQKELQNKGYPAFTAQGSNDLTKVFVGGQSQDQSHHLKKDLENSGYLKTFVVKRAP
jgi:cell division septation protein DedD